MIAVIAVLLLAALSAFSLEEGYASWYGGKFHGRKTANGEIFNTNDFTAAHRTLPFGTVVKITNTANEKSVVVRINDRGPFVKGRILDLSQAAAAELGMLTAGVAFVRIEKVRGGPDATPGKESYILQVASYKVRDNAAALLNLLKKNGIEASLEISEAGMTRVVIGDVEETALSILKEKLAVLGFPNPLIRKKRGM